MAKNKTTQTDNSVSAYLDAIVDEKRRTDVTALVELISEHTGLEPTMWGTGIVGFGIYKYTYESGHSGNAPLVGAASRTNAIVLYLFTEFNQKAALLQQFGKHKTGKGCIYIKKLEDINTGILKEMVTNSIEYLRNKYPD